MAKKGNDSRQEGYRQEERAAQFLEQKGYRILTRNFYSRWGEIDIVAKKQGYLVFVEVRYRKDAGEGHPLETVDIRKQRRICRTALYYCMRHGYGEQTPCRFDVVGICGEEIIHIEDAFPYLPE